MANAFSPGRVSIWHTDLNSFRPAYDAMVKLGGTDVFFDADDPHLTTAVMDLAKTKLSSDGKLWRPQLAKIWRGQDGVTFANDLLGDIAAFHPGVAELDMEGPSDPAIGNVVSLTLAQFRNPSVAWRMAFPLCFNVVPMKGYVLPIQQMAADPNCYVRVQRYYGAEMRPAEADLCRSDIVDRGFPAYRFSFMESAKPRRLNDGTLFIDLPLFTDHGAQVRKLSRGGIFNANLLREAGLI